MARDKPNSDDYLGGLSKIAQENHRKKIDALFSRHPNSVDWADDLAKDVIVEMFETAEFMGKVYEYFDRKDISIEDKRSELAWSIMVPLSLELRHLRHDAMSVVDGKVKYRAEQLRKKFADPSFLAEYVRNKAGDLDGRGMTTEANVLRDAADILSEDFK